jgi:hypothetical protein
MPWFRAPLSTPARAGAMHGPLPVETIQAVIAEALRPGHFFVGGTVALDWAPPAEETVRWEIFRGRLVDAAHTRQQRTYEAWNVFLLQAGSRSAEPVLSVKRDPAAGQVHVVRAIYCYAWEGYNAGGNVYESRETRKWVRELVGTIDLGRFADVDALRDELICRLFQAVVGTSRLPLTSVEAPLPAFALGQLAYFYRPALAAEDAARPMASYRELAAVEQEVRLARVERAKLLETLLHATPPGELGVMANLFLGADTAPGELLLMLFNEVSLSPYTDLVDKALALLRTREDREAADFLGSLLRRIGRHLTAYDLVTFHHRGANYPDALLLDALLAAYLDLADRRPELFVDAVEDREPETRRRRLRRRALRQGWLLRSLYEGHPVPDAPTSQGEALRVLPEPHVRVPEEQILQPARRSRRLFAGDPLTERLRGPTSDLLRQSLADLRQPDELRELGTALFLDRPLGAGKAPTEPDATPLLSYEAFSRAVAGRRLQHLADKLGLISAEEHEAHRQALARLEVAGVPLDAVHSTARPGAVSLADARQVAGDFVLLRTTAGTAADFLSLYDFTSVRERLAMDYLEPGRRLLIAGGASSRGTGGTVTVYDAALRRRLEMAFDAAAGYESRGGVEWPARGLRILRAWDEDGRGALQECDVESEWLVIRPA